ncbi:MAG: hypothetical protein EBQ85_12315 [Proteobacteria bacterium]|nr:hypothetical protein [Pseudomonadota bacterium]
METGGRDHEGRIFNNQNGKDGVYSQRREGTSIRELASQLASDPEALAAFREALSVNTPAMNKGLSGKGTGSEQLSDRRKPSVESYGDSYSYRKNALESGAGTQTSSNTFSGNQSENRSSADNRSSGVTSLRRGDSFSGSGPSGDFSSSSPQTSGNSNGLTGSSNSFSTGSGSSTNSYSNASAETSARRKTGEQSYNPATYWTLPAGSGNLSDIAEVAAEASTESTGTPTKSNSEKAVASNSISLTPEELGKVKDILAPVPTKATELPAILKAQPGSGQFTDFVDSMGEPSTASRGLASRSPVPKAASKKPSSEKDFWGKVRAFFKF